MESNPFALLMPPQGNRGPDACAVDTVLGTGMMQFKDSFSPFTEEINSHEETLGTDHSRNNQTLN